MAETPVRRGPGRPRKVTPVPLKTEAPPEPSAIAEVPEETVGKPVQAADKAPPSDPDDPRVGQEVHPLATHIGFDDGSQYECADGLAARRVG